VTPQQLAPIIFIVAILLAIGIRVWRASREQRFAPGSMWIIPIIFAAYVGWVIFAEGYIDPLDLGLMVLALAVGLGIGMYQGTHTTIRVDHAAHAMFVKISPLGSMIFIGVLVLRIAVRYYLTGGFAMAGGAGAPGYPLIAHTPANLISLLLLVLALGVIAGLRFYLQRFYNRARATL
jgi:membrane protein CcdC involved in cytochrome C biogenesis